MALTNLTGFIGDAEILGALLTVEFRDATLMIRGVSLEATTNILEVLSTKELVAVRLPTSAQKATAPVVQEYAPPEKETKAPKAQRAKKVEQEPSEPAEKIVETAPADEAKKSNEPPPWVTEGTEEETKPVRALSVVKDHPQQVQEKPETVQTQAMPEEIAKSGRFFVIMKWVQATYNIPSSSPDRIAAALAEYKDHPAIRRVRDLKDKVASTLLAHDETGNA